MPIRPRHCNPCDRSYDVFCRDGLGRFYDQDAEESVETDMHCGVCGGTDTKKLVSYARIIFGGDVAGHGKIYPFTDINLLTNGKPTLVTSKAHHDRLMKARGLHHVTLQDVQDEARRVEAEDREIVECGIEHDREIETSDTYREFRELRDKGAFVEHVPKEKRAKAIEYQKQNEGRW